MSASLKPGGVVDGQQIFDGSHVLAADFGVREFTDEQGLDAILFTAAGRYLYSGDGTTVALNFTSNTELSFFGGNIIFESNGDFTAEKAAVSIWDGTHTSINTIRQLIANDGSTVSLDWSDPTVATFSVPIAGDGSQLTGVSASTVTGTTTNDNAAAGIVGEYISASVVQASAVSLTTATPKTVTSISLTAGDWDVTAIGSITGASTGTEFDVAVGTTTNSLTGTVLGDTRCQTPTVSLAGADASLMIPAMRVSISSTTIHYLIVQETFTLGSPKAYGRISARRVR